MGSQFWEQIIEPAKEIKGLFLELHLERNQEDLIQKTAQVVVNFGVLLQNCLFVIQTVNFGLVDIGLIESYVKFVLEENFLINTCYLFKF